VWLLYAVDSADTARKIMCMGYEDMIDDGRFEGTWYDEENGTYETTTCLRKTEIRHKITVTKPAP